MGKLIFLYDQNHITIDGKTEITYSDDVQKRFEGYNWHVQDLGESANDLDRIQQAYEEAQQVKDKPSLIILRSHIAWGSPGKQDSPEAHGSALGEDEVRKTKEVYGWPADKTFYIPDEVKEYMHRAVERGEKIQGEWQAMYDRYKEQHQDAWMLLEKGRAMELDEGWDKEIPDFQTRRRTSGHPESLVKNHQCLCRKDSLPPRRKRRSGLFHQDPDG